jgi:predicted amidohydrolase YtcJ
MDGQNHSQEGLAVVIRKNLIVFAGPQESIEKRRLAKARVVNLDGRLLMPGIIESHGHLFGAGFTRLGLDLRGMDTLEETLAAVGQVVPDKKSGDWIIGSGWDHTDWPGGRFPNRRDFDRVAPEKPVLLTRIGGHSVWVNSLALDMAGITAETADPDGGTIVRDEEGTPTGILLDNAFSFFEDYWIDEIGSNPVKLLKAAQEEAFENGITTFHDIGFPSAYLPIYKWLYRFGIMKINARVYVADDDKLNRYITKNSPESLLNDRLRIAGIKAVADGAMGSFGALLIEPYADRPGTSRLQTTSDERLMEIAVLARENGYQLAVHAIGDLANANVIEAYQAVIGPDPEDRYRWRIEHAQFLRPEDIRTIGINHYIPSMQPRHATTDMKWVESRLGVQRSKTAYAW